MKRNQINQLRIHFVPTPDGQKMTEQANQYHIQIIERRLNESGLTPKQKVEILAGIKSRI